MGEVDTVPPWKRLVWRAFHLKTKDAAANACSARSPGGKGARLALCFGAEVSIPDSGGTYFSTRSFWV